MDPAAADAAVSQLREEVTKATERLHTVRPLLQRKNEVATCMPGTVGRWLALLYAI